MALTDHLPAWLGGGRTAGTGLELAEAGRGSTGSTGTALVGTALMGTVTTGTEVVAARAEMAEFLAEALADHELALEDAGWRRLTAQTDENLTREGLRQATAVAQALCVTNALARRGVALRIGYIWGHGLQITARSAGQDGKQDVNAVIQAFLDDDGNRAAVTGEQAREELERALATDGNFFVALFTAPRTGRVQARLLPYGEITEPIRNPEDRTEVWFWLREWTETTLGVDGATATVQRRALYPDLRYRPRTRLSVISGVPVQWDTPVRHVCVNRLSGWDFGIGDLYTAIPWARGYHEFLSDWKKLVAALSRFAWKKTPGKGSRTRQAATRAVAAAGSALTAATGGAAGPGVPVTESRAGALIETESDLTAIPKTGATIDSESGRPLAAMVAAALDVPVTMLLGDPGMTGARATAETLDEPTKLAMQMRRTRHTEWLRDVLGYVVREAVRAPQGPLKGTVTRDEFGREVVALTGDDEATVEVTWPPLEKDSVKERLDAVAVADGLGKLPPLLIVRLALEALEVPNIDEVLDDLTDEHGDFIDPEVDAGVAAVRAFNRGKDPAATLNPPAGQQQPGQQQGQQQGQQEPVPVPRTPSEAAVAALDAARTALTERAQG